MYPAYYEKAYNKGVCLRFPDRPVKMAQPIDFFCYIFTNFIAKCINTIKLLVGDQYNMLYV